MILLLEYGQSFHACYRPLVVSDCFAAITDLVQRLERLQNFVASKGPLGDYPFRVVVMSSKLGKNHFLAFVSCAV